MSEARPSLWRVTFLAELYGRMTLTLEEVAEQIGLAPGTIRNRRTAGEFTWFKSDGRQLYADVADVAAFLEQRRTAGEAPPSTQPRIESASHPTDAPSPSSGRRRRSPSPAESL